MSYQVTPNPPQDLGQSGQASIGMDAKMAAALGYPIGIISIIVLCTEKVNPFVKFHALQGLLYHVGAGIAYGVGIMLVALVCLLISLLLGLLAGAVGKDAAGLFLSLIFLVWGIWYLFVILAPIAILVGNILAAVKAYNGKLFRIPIVGKFAANFAKLPDSAFD